MYGGPRHGGLRRETGLPLAAGHRGRWATWSTIPPDSPESRGSATTTCWARGACTSSPGALTWWRGSWSPPPRCAGWLTWPRSWNSPTVLFRRYIFEAGAALVPGRPGHRAVLRRALGRALLPAGGGAPAGWDRHETRLPAHRRGWSPSSTLMESSRAFFSATDDRDEQGFRIYGVVGRLDTPLPELNVSGSGSTATSPRWTGHRCSAARIPGVRLMGEGLTRHTH